jgi:uncharacterized protein YbjT (DUF2867 family)
MAHRHAHPNNLVLVTGASGKIGAQVVQALHRHHSAHLSQRILLRDPAKGAEFSGLGEIVKGDFTDAASLDAALAGVHSLFLLLPFVPNALELTKAAVDAAKRAGVKFIVKLSAIGAAADAQLPVGRDHFAQEQLVRQSGIPFAILQPT